MTTFRKEKKRPFDPTQGVVGVCYMTAYCFHGALCSIPFNLICNMTFGKRYSLTFWCHPLGRGCVCGQNICYHVAASVISFNLICNMTIFWKSFILASAPPPESTKQAQTQAFKLKSCLICFKCIAALPACKISAKIFTIALVITKLKYLTFDPLGGVKRGGVKLWHCHAYLQALGNDKLLNIIALMKCEDHHTKKLT